jgi:hypothetical protein
MAWFTRIPNGRQNVRPTLAEANRAIASLHFSFYYLVCVGVSDRQRNVILSIDFFNHSQPDKL